MDLGTSGGNSFSPCTSLTGHTQVSSPSPTHLPCFSPAILESPSRDNCVLSLIPSVVRSAHLIWFVLRRTAGFGPFSKRGGSLAFIARPPRLGSPPGLCRLGVSPRPSRHHKREPFCSVCAFFRLLFPLPVFPGGSRCFFSSSPPKRTVPFKETWRSALSRPVGQAPAVPPYHLKRPALFDGLPLVYRVLRDVFFMTDCRSWLVLPFCVHSEHQVPI